MAKRVARNLSQADLGFTISFSAYHGNPNNRVTETKIGQTGSLVVKLFTFGGRSYIRSGYNESVPCRLTVLSFHGCYKCWVTEINCLTLCKFT